MGSSAPAAPDGGRAVPAAIITPDTVETRIGTLHFSDGMPSADTLEKVYDHLDFTHAFEAFVNALGGVNTHAIHRGLLDAGVKDNELLILALLDSAGLVLTGNTDTVYVAGILDLTGGPMVVEAPPRLLGAMNDYWARWVMDVGGPGADRGLGGRYLVVPPGYDGPLPEGGFSIARPSTLHVLLFGRLFLQDGETAPAVEAVRTLMKVYPYQAGGVGTSFASFLRGEARLGPVTPPPETVIHDLSGAVFDTVMPNDFSYYEWLDEVVQQEPAGSLDAELMGSVAAIGIVKGRQFAPDERMKKDPHRRGRGRQRDGSQPVDAAAGPRLVLLSGLGLDAAHGHRHRPRLRDVAAGHRGAGEGRRADADGGRTPVRPPATATWTRAPTSRTASSASVPRSACS